MAQPVRLSRKLIIQMPVAAFFQAATMTDRVERLAGLPAARFTMSHEPGGRSALRADARLLGVPVHWYELPFEWVENRYWRVHRIFEGVPVRWITITTSLAALDPEHTQLDLVVEVLPRNILGRLGAVLVFGVYTLTRIVAVYRKLESRYRAQEPTLFPPALRSAVRAGALELYTRDLRATGLPPAHINRLVNHLTTGLDDEVKDMRPFALADRWGIPRLAGLRLFLYATRAGLLDLHWDVLCPNCRVAKATVGNLTDLAGDAHCDTCNIRYDVNFDEYVELRFTVNSAVREIYSAVFCIAAPYQTRHIVAQFRLAPGTTQVLVPGLAPGVYRWRTRQRPERGHLRITPAGARTPQRYRFLAGAVESPPGDPSTAPDAELWFENTTPEELLVILEKQAWAGDGVSAAQVTAIQEFRDMFSSQVLAPGIGVSLRSLTVLFSDLKDSTMLYDRVGDSSAFARVRDHFVIMREAIAAHNGAIVKTIGDAVMAVFSVPADAVAAGLAIQAGIAHYNTGAGDNPLCVKLGLHRGPCIAINANDVLDYFGSTVNIASRVQATSQGADLVLTDRVYEDPGVQELLAGQRVDSFQTTLKGLSQLFTLYQVQTARPALVLAEPR